MLTGVAIFALTSLHLLAAAASLARKRRAAGELRWSTIPPTATTITMPACPIPRELMGRLGRLASTRRYRHRRRQDRRSASRPPPAPRPRPPMAAWCCRPSSISTPISTRAHLAAPLQSGRHLEAAQPARSATRSSAGRPPMSSGAWISRCAAPMRMARPPSAPTSDRRRRSTTSPGMCSRPMRARWAGRIELQAVSLIGPQTLLDAAASSKRSRRASPAAGGVLGWRDRGAIRRRARPCLPLVETAGELWTRHRPPRRRDARSHIRCAAGRSPTR